MLLIFVKTKIKTTQAEACATGGTIVVCKFTLSAGGRGRRYQQACESPREWPAVDRSRD